MLEDFRNDHKFSYKVHESFFIDNTDISPPQVIRMLLGMCYVHDNFWNG